MTDDAEPPRIVRICPDEAELLDSEEKRTCPAVGCGKVFAKAPNLKMHLAKHHKIGELKKNERDEGPRESQYFCPRAGCPYRIDADSGRWFSQMRLLKQHFAKVHAPKRFSCALCGWRSGLRSQVRRHAAVCLRSRAVALIVVDGRSPPQPAEVKKDSAETQTCDETPATTDCDFEEFPMDGYESGPTCFKETQTCSCFLSSETFSNASDFDETYDEPFPRQFCASVSTETQTQSPNRGRKFLTRKCDVMLSCSSIETQTYKEDFSLD